MKDFELTPEARRMLFEMAKHLTTLNGAAIVLVLALLEKFAGRPFNPTSVKWTIGWFVFSLLASVCAMFVLVGVETSGKQRARNLLFIALGHIGGFTGFFFGLFNLIFLSLESLG